MPHWDQDLGLCGSKYHFITADTFGLVSIPRDFVPWALNVVQDLAFRSLRAVYLDQRHFVLSTEHPAPLNL